MNVFIFAVILVSWLPFSEGECTAAQSGMFPCDEHRCIPYDYVCDGVPQCNDKTDETSAFCEVVNNLPNVGLDTTNKVDDVTTPSETETVTPTDITPTDIDPSDSIDNVPNTTQSVTKQATSAMVVTVKDNPTDGGVNTTVTKDDVRTSESNTGETSSPNGAELFLSSLLMTLLLSVVGCKMLT